MAHSDLSRRDFNRLTAAAFGGLLAGASAGCASRNAMPPSDGSKATGTGKSPDELTGADADVETPDEGAGPGPANFLVGEKHACRGLNACKGHGQGGENACAGQGACATIAEHVCGGHNECKGQGGCGAHPAQNSCKGKGGCSIPLHAGAWEKAREAFEERMREQSTEFGAAPEPVKG